MGFDARFLFGHEAEWIFTLIAVAFASGALVLGWRVHRSSKVAGFFLLGIIGLLASRGLEMGSHDDHHGHHSEAGHTEDANWLDPLELWGERARILGEQRHGA